LKTFANASGEKGESTGESENYLKGKNKFIDSEESSDANQEYVDELPSNFGKIKKGPRMSVSAEVFGKFNK
jgi:hypothetical protein